MNQQQAENEHKDKMLNVKVTSFEKKILIRRKKIILLYIVYRMVVFHFWHWRMVRNVSV